MCENTNSSSVMKALYGQDFSGLLFVASVRERLTRCTLTQFSRPPTQRLWPFYRWIRRMPRCGLACRASTGALTCPPAAEYFRSPYADTNLLKVPDNVSDEKAMFLSDIVCTSYHSVVDIDFKEGQTAAIWGAGPVGLNIAQWLKKVRSSSASAVLPLPILIPYTISTRQCFHAKRVVIIDNVQNRLDFARENIGVEILHRDNDCPDGLVAKLYEMEPLGWDASFDVAGFRYAQSLLHKAMRATALETDSPENLNECIQATRKHGRISIAADYAGLANGTHGGDVQPWEAADVFSSPQDSTLVP